MSGHSEEKRDFEIFQRLFPDAIGTFVHGGNDFPDFGNIQCGLAVEHTRAFLGPQSNKGSQAKAIESHKKQACSQIQVSLGSLNIQPYEVPICFWQDPIDSVALAKEFLDPLQTHLRAHGPIKLSRADDASVSLPSSIWEAEFIPVGTSHYVYPTEVARLVQGPADSVQKAIDPKNERLKKYRGAQVGRLPFSKFWLLIVADPWNMELPEDTKQHWFNSDFDQTFFLERTPERLTPLKRKV